MMNRKPKDKRKNWIPIDEDVIEIVTCIETSEPCEEYEDENLALANESIDNILDKNMRQKSPPCSRS